MPSMIPVLDVVCKSSPSILLKLESEKGSFSSFDAKASTVYITQAGLHNTFLTCQCYQKKHPREESI